MSEAFSAFESYDWALLIVGVAVLGVATLPRLLHDKPLNVPPLVIALGVLAWTLPLGLERFDPVDEHAYVTERVTELGVIVSLMVVGLGIDRPFSWRGWSSTWRLLGVTMPLTIAGAAIFGWWAGLVPATAALLGACVAPTDPVLGKDVEIGPPGEGTEPHETEDHDPTGPGEEDEVRFALSSEAGMNDGLAFPFTNLAIAMAVAGAAPGNWFGTWVTVHVLYELTVAFVLGLLFGKLFAAVILRVPSGGEASKTMTGMASLAATLLVYGGTELLGGYGFIATFVAAATLRRHDRWNDYHEHLEVFAEQVERSLLVLIMFFFGGSIATGLFDALTWELALVAVAVVFLLRPLAGAIAMIGFPLSPWRDKAAISFFGIRGIATFYYLAHAIEEAEFGQVHEIWAVAGLIVLVSVVVHGVTAAPVLTTLDRRRHGTEFATKRHPYVG